ncbi:MAG: hypothetical protein ACKOU6_20820 [Planctomycetota bacterium]
MGLQWTRWPSAAAEAVCRATRALTWQPQLPLVDHYIRGTDVVASYADTARTMVAECYWRLLQDDSPVIGWEWIISVQTSLLDCHPHVETRSTLPPGELLVSNEPQVAGFRAATPAATPTATPAATTTATPAATPAAVARLVRPAGSDYSLVELFFPGDQASWELRETAGADLSWLVHWQVDALEKGVIRRCRARACWVPRQDDEQWASRCWRSLLDSPLPLTV